MDNVDVDKTLTDWGKFALIGQACHNFATIKCHCCHVWWGPNVMKVAMTDSYIEFQQRVARIHDAQAPKRFFFKSKNSCTVNDQGHFVLRGAKRRRGVPWTGLFLVAVAFFGVKGAVMAQLGNDFYQKQVARLMPASALERAGAWTMQADPISRWVALRIKSLS